MNDDGKWCTPKKINNKQYSVVHKKGKYDDIIKKYLQKLDDQKHKKMLRMQLK